jgi:hypothetical protein
LAAGFFRALRAAGLRFPAGRRPRWADIRPANSWLFLLTLLTLGYPVALLFRLTRSGWEIGNRLGPLSFYGVAIVLAVLVDVAWRAQSTRRSFVAASAATLVLLGGIISSEGPRILVPAVHRVSDDSSSVEPLGIAAASWTADWLGWHNVFAADRINRLLLSTYGRQDVATTLYDPRDTSLALTSDTMGVAEAKVLREVGVDFVLTDLRLTTALPSVGVYFDGGVADRGYRNPLRPAALLKFNNEPSVGRVFDNGYLVIFDVRGLRER